MCKDFLRSKKKHHFKRNTNNRLCHLFFCPCRVLWYLHCKKSPTGYFSNYFMPSWHPTDLSSPYKRVFKMNFKIRRRRICFNSILHKGFCEGHFLCKVKSIQLLPAPLLLSVQLELLWFSIPVKILGKENHKSRSLSALDRYLLCCL